MANYGGQSDLGRGPAHQLGGQIAANTGGVQYEDETPGTSLSGGVNPSTGQSIHNPINGSGGRGLSSQAGSTTANLGSARPNVTDVGVNTGGQSLADQVKAANAPGNYGSGLGSSGVGQSTSSGVGSGLGQTTGQTTGTQSTTSAQPPTGSAYDQAARGAQVVADKAQELSQPIQPYIQKVQETVGPYVQTAVEKTGPYVQQAREAASPYVEKASVLANQGIQATAAELDRRGVNIDSIQQKTADVSQSLKDYGTVGQARAGEYLQQAVDQAKTIGSDRENKNIVVTIFGTIALIWLAFGFSITALLALGIAGGLAAVLSRYSRAATDARGQHVTSRNGVPTTSSQRSNAAVETHYPNPSHPDNSLNN